MKRILVTLAAAVLLLSVLSACGTNNVVPTATPIVTIAPIATTTPVVGPTATIGPATATIMPNTIAPGTPVTSGTTGVPAQGSPAT